MPGSSQELLSMNLNSVDWRLGNLYTIKSKEDGKKIAFYRRQQQYKLLQVLKTHKRILVIKARQLGMSTLIGLLMTDTMIWSKDWNGAVIADTQANSKNLFTRNIRDVYADFSTEFPELTPGAEIESENASFMKLSNGSSIYTGTRLRSGAYDFLHCSELGVVAHVDPTRYNEILAGAFETVGKTGTIVVETTCMGGRNTKFYDLVKQALQNEADGNDDPLAWKVLFFPWYEHPDYCLEESKVKLHDKDIAYFNMLRDEHDIKLFNRTCKEVKGKKQWYVDKKRILGDQIFNEHPSILEEAFHVSMDGAIYSDQVMNARLENRLSTVPFDNSQPLYVAMDLGYSDSTSIIWFQIGWGGNVNVIDFYENSGKNIQHYIDILQNKYQSYTEIFVPHDAMNLTVAADNNVFNQIRKFFKTTVLPRTNDVWVQINNVRGMFTKMYIDNSKCIELIKHLENYSKRFNAATGCYVDTPVHDNHSHACDAFRYMVQAINDGNIKQGSSNQRTRPLQNKTGRMSDFSKPKIQNKLA